jgi:hypothetical protein
MTSDAPQELIEHGVYTSEQASAVGQLMVRSEYLVEDVNSFASLASRRLPVGILSGRDLERPPTRSRVDGGSSAPKTTQQNRHH